MKLSAKHKAFVREYQKDGNATRAAKAAGYSKKTAYSSGQRLLKKAEIAQELEKKAKILSDKVDLSVEWVVRRLMMRANFDVRKFYREDGSLRPIAELDEETAYALQGLEIEKLYEHFGKGQAQDTGTLTKIKFADRDRALELLGRHLKMFTDKVEVSNLDQLADALAQARQRAAGGANV